MRRSLSRLLALALCLSLGGVPLPAEAASIVRGRVAPVTLTPIMGGFTSPTLGSNLTLRPLTAPNGLIVPSLQVTNVLIAAPVSVPPLRTPSASLTLEQQALSAPQLTLQAAAAAPGERLRGQAGEVFDLSGPARTAPSDDTPGKDNLRGSLQSPEPGPSRHGRDDGPPRPRPKTKTGKFLFWTARLTGVYAVWTVYRDGVLVQKYAGWLSDPHEKPARRAAAAKLLARLGRSEPIEALAWSIEHDADPRVRQAALAALLKLSETWRPTLAREMRLHPLPGKRQAAARVLSVLARFADAPEVVEALAAAAALDPNEDVRLTAIEGLASAASPKALVSLAWLRKQDLPPHVRSAVEVALSRGSQLQLSLRNHVHVEPPAGDFEDAKQPLYTTALKRVLAVGVVFLAVEFVGGLLTGSLSLQADAMHMAADLSITAGALFSVWMSRRPPNSRKTYGYLKLESLVGLLSAVAITFMAGHMAWEAFGRLWAPVAVPGWSTILLALAGLSSNAISSLILYRYRDENLSLRGAFLHAATDALGSVGIITAGILMLSFGWFIADPIISFVIVALILHTTWGLAKRSFNVLIDSVPAGLVLDTLEKDMLAVDGVVSVYDLHAWSLNSSQNVATAVVYIRPGAAHDSVLAALKTVLSEKHGIKHSTLQLETLKP